MQEKSDLQAENILHSLNGLQKAEAPAFLYTRIIGRMQGELVIRKRPFMILRPVFITAVLFVVFIINIISLNKLNKIPNSQTTVITNNSATIESFANAYNLGTESVYE